MAKFKINDFKPSKELLEYFSAAVPDRTLLMEQLEKQKRRLIRNRKRKERKIEKK